MADKAQEWISKGLDILKVKLGEDIRTDAERMYAIHEAVDGKARLRIDANQGWSVKDTLEVGSELAALGVDLIEQPVAAALDIIREVDLDSVYILAQDKVRGGFDHRGGKAVLWDVPGIGCKVKGESE